MKLTHNWSLPIAYLERNEMRLAPRPRLNKISLNDVKLCSRGNDRAAGRRARLAAHRQTTFLRALEPYDQVVSLLGHPPFPEVRHLYRGDGSVLKTTEGPITTLQVDRQAGLGQHSPLISLRRLRSNRPARTFSKTSSTILSPPKTRTPNLRLRKSLISQRRRRRETGGSHTTKTSRRSCMKIRYVLTCAYVITTNAGSFTLISHM